jgi:rhodanese-related sulfurtransferase
MQIGTKVMLFTRKIRTLSPSETWTAHQGNGLVLVDVRQQPEWRSGVVSGALLIPLNELPRRLGELPREKTVAFICRSGHRSALAARQARRHGLDVVSVTGGMTAWQKAGLPTSAPHHHARHRA